MLLWRDAGARGPVVYLYLACTWRPSHDDSLTERGFSNGGRLSCAPIFKHARLTGQEYIACRWLLLAAGLQNGAHTTVVLGTLGLGKRGPVARGTTTSSLDGTSLKEG